MKNDVDFDETKFEKDEYGNLIPHEDEPETEIKISIYDD